MLKEWPFDRRNFTHGCEVMPITTRKKSPKTCNCYFKVPEQHEWSHSELPHFLLRNEDKAVHMLESSSGREVRMQAPQAILVHIASVAWHVLVSII